MVVICFGLIDMIVMNNVAVPMYAMLMRGKPLMTDDMPQRKELSSDNPEKKKHARIELPIVTCGDFHTLAVAGFCDEE